MQVQPGSSYDFFWKVFFGIVSLLLLFLSGLSLYQKELYDALWAAFGSAVFFWISLVFGFIDELHPDSVVFHFGIMKRDVHNKDILHHDEFIDQFTGKGIACFVLVIKKFPFLILFADYDTKPAMKVLLRKEEADKA